MRALQESMVTAEAIMMLICSGVHNLDNLYNNSKEARTTWYVIYAGVERLILRDNDLPKVVVPKLYSTPWVPGQTHNGTQGMTPNCLFFLVF